MSVLFKDFQIFSKRFIAFFSSPFLKKESAIPFRPPTLMPETIS